MTEQSGTTTTAERQLCEKCGSPDHLTEQHKGRIAGGQHEGSVAGERPLQKVAQGQHEGSVAGERPSQTGEDDEQVPADITQ